MAPILRAWVAVGSGKGDPLALLGAGAGDPIAASYISQHRPLLLLALGREDEGLVELRNRVEAQDSRAQTLQISAAARLAREGKQEEALGLLTGDGNSVTGARAWLERQKSLPGEIATPAQGVSEFFLRLAIDLRRQDVVPLAVSFARMSTFLAPERSESWLVTSALLAGQGDGREALAALERIPPADPAAPLVEDVRIGLLAAIGDKREALEQAEKATAGSKASVADWTRLGDLYGQLERHLDAAEAYRRALDLKGQQPDGRAAWALWLLRGGALERADHWPAAKAALGEAHRLAPNEPLVLNYLGYAQLERRENLAGAEKLIRQASNLQPDSAQITDSLGWANYLQGNVATAVELLERAVEGEPTDPAINEHLGDAYYAVGRRYEARYAWSAALVVAEEKDAARLRAKIAAGLTPELASP
jgi:Flp pilus assembly protein TadD